MAVRFIQHQHQRVLHGILVLESLQINRKIYNSLSIPGSFAYKAAMWQFYTMTSQEYGTLDAGMLYLRLFS